VVLDKGLAKFGIFPILVMIFSRIQRLEMALMQRNFSAEVSFDSLGVC
jgi:hypothetical protein